MQITIIHGQNHAGNTWKMTRMFTDAICGELSERDAKPDIAEFFLPRDLPDFCTGCNNCFLKGEDQCPHAVPVQRIVRKIDEADILLIDSPCYAMNMSAALKTLFDHMAYRWMAHRPHPQMFGKTALLLSTAAGAGTGKVLDAMAINLRYWGISDLFRYGKNVGDFSDSRLIRRIAGDAAYIARKIARRATLPVPAAYNISFTTRFLFSVMRLNQKANVWNMTDKWHWLRNGWLGKLRPWVQYNEYDDELWDVYDENRNKTGRTHRRGNPLAPGDYHLVVHVCILSPDGKLLIQKRAPWKKTWPGVWDLSAAGSAIAGDDGRSAAVREVREELGLDVDLDRESPIRSVRFETGFDDFWRVTLDTVPEKIRFLKTEVVAVRWVTLDEYEALASGGEAVPYKDPGLFFGPHAEPRQNP